MRVDLSALDTGCPRIGIDAAISPLFLFLGGFKK
jgi:hypothetical protein